MSPPIEVAEPRQVAVAREFGFRVQGVLSLVGARSLLDIVGNWCDQHRRPPWHIDAGKGAVHPIRSGQRKTIPLSPFSLRINLDTSVGYFGPEIRNTPHPDGDTTTKAQGVFSLHHAVPSLAIKAGRVGHAEWVGMPLAHVSLGFVRKVPAQLLGKKLHQHVAKIYMIFGFAFPNDENIPAELAEPTLNSSVSFHVVENFRLPIIRSGLRIRRSLAAGMTVPKATMNENNLSPARKYEVRRSGQISTVQAKSITESMSQTANAHFRDRVLAANSGHQRASFRIYQWFAISGCPA